MSVADATYLFRRKNTYYFRIAVPNVHHETYGKQIWRSLKTGDLKTAKAAVAELTSRWLNYFRTGENPPEDRNEKITPEASINRARELGITEKHAPEEFLKARAEESIEMLKPIVKALKEMKRPSALDIVAASGALEISDLRISGALDRYKQLTPGKWSNLDARAYDKKWRPYARAIADFIEAVSDMEVWKMKRTHAFKFASALSEQVDAGKINVESAMKKIMWLKIILQKLIDAEFPDRINPFDKVTIENNRSEKGKRPAFTNSEAKAVRKRIEESDANEQLKALATIAEFTGTTCKELAFLMPEDIFLDAPVPYIAIRPNAMRAKVKSGGERHRDIPLYGPALEAAKKFPDGFDKYRRHNGPEALSASFNKLIKDTAPGKTWYSYRHHFADVLRRSKCQDTMKDALMGHASANPHQNHYGEGYTLENKLEALTIAFLKAENETN
ncbi:DUF6538 domain-containing protein [Rhizobium leucaenae]|uniref:DUF6538 domain-containing protein n=1 Tax=Rhizobium leucaenae TaxID=29450 RepID=UPI001615DC81|nr:DUF6538 domain-containing protein [Rhizobium leucaenae]MBB6301680.1 integrase [Rhizobium leucaenae]